MNHEKLWSLKLTHSDVINIYQTTTNPTIKKKIENHFLAHKMSNRCNWSGAQWNAAREYYDQHNDYPEDSWWDAEVGDWAYLNDEGEIAHPVGCVFAPLPFG